MVNGESQLARKTLDDRNASHTRRAGLGASKAHETARTFPGVRGKTSTVSANQQKCKTPPRAEAELTRDGHVCTSVRFVCSGDGKSGHTRFLHRLSGKITARSGSGRNARTRQALDKTATCTAEPRFQNPRRSVLRIGRLLTERTARSHQQLLMPGRARHSLPRRTERACWQRWEPFCLGMRLTYLQQRTGHVPTQTSVRPN